MTPEEFEATVKKYDPNIGDLGEQIEQELSADIASASAELFAALEDRLWDRIKLIANQRVGTALLFDWDGEETADPPSDDQAGYEFDELNLRSAQDHAGDAAGSLQQCEVEFLLGMLKKTRYPIHNVSQGTNARH